MNHEYQQEAVKIAAKSKFRGRKTLNSKVTPQYPDSLVREYRGITNSYMKLVNEVVAKHMPEIKVAAKAQQAEVADATRSDGINDLMSAVQRAFSKMEKELEEKIDEFDLNGKIARIASLIQRSGINQWKKIVKQTLGLDLDDGYYTGEFLREMVDKWVDTNVSLIKTIPNEALSEMQSIVSSGYMSGKNTTAIAREIQEAYSTNKSRARFYARDQVAKLNSDLTKKQQKDAGVNRYTWRTGGDQRVRDDHRRLNKHQFSWDDPPIVDEKTGRRCHPGEDYNCRCVAIPVFDFETLDVPASSGKGGG